MAVIVVTGTPGVGKTVFSRRLAGILGYEYVSLNDVIIGNRLYTGYDKERGSYIVDIDAASRFISKRYSRGSYVVEGHVAHLVVEPSLLEVCIVLRCSPYELRRRLVERGYGDEKVMENVQAEILDVIYCEAVERYGAERVVQVDATGDPEGRAEEVAEMLRRGELRSDRVDWLTQVYERGDLAAFFPSEPI